jgi:hypothetical protein
MTFLKIKKLNAAANRITLKINLEGYPGARIYRSQRKRGPYEEVGLAQNKVFIDTAAMTPGTTCYYLAASWTSSWLIPEPNELRSGRPVSVEVPRAPREKRTVVRRKRQAIPITLGGYLDRSNTVTKQPSTYCPGPGHRNPPHDQVFEPEVYVAIENTGHTDIINPWLVVDGRRDWWSIESMAEEIRTLAGGSRADDNELAMAVWKFVSEEIYDQRAGLSDVDRADDPVRLFNSFGFAGCSPNALACRRLSEVLGLKAREVRLGSLALLDGHGRGGCCDHDIYEAWADGAWHFLDTDLIVYLLNRDNWTAAGSQDLVRDADLLVRNLGKNGLQGRDLLRSHFYYEYFRRNLIVINKYKSRTWNDDAGNLVQATDRYPPAHTMALRLRPGEKLLRYWDNIGKNLVRGPGMHPAAPYSNGKLSYRPDLRGPLWRKGAKSSKGLAHKTQKKHPALHPRRTGTTAEAVWEIRSPYAIAGARVGLSCRRETREDALEVLISLDGKHWRSVWMTPGHESVEKNYLGSRMDVSIELDCFVDLPGREIINPTLHSFGVGPCYGYFIKVAMWAGSAPAAVGLDAIRFDTDIQCATRSLPSLALGKNKVVYRDENSGPRQVSVTYGWQEHHEIKPPDAPQLLYPESNGHVAKLDFEFAWKHAKGNGARVDDYHIQISRYKDFRWCVSPMFDRYVSRGKYQNQTRWQAELPNLLNPDECYYWRVRARNAKGVWSEWSETGRFTPHGPGEPLNLKIKHQDRKRTLTWQVNPKGNRPETYQVHASTDLGGFTATRKTLLATVASTSYPLSSSTKGHSFRIIAIDVNKVPSTPSDFVVS